MDPVSLIVSALVNGALQGVARVAEQAVFDGYTALRSAIARRYGGSGLERAVQDLEAAPKDRVRQDEVARELRRVGADADPELIRLAGGLLETIENPVDQVVSPVERLQRRAGLRAVEETLDHHVGALLTIRAHQPVDDTDLLSGGRARNGVPPAVEDEIERLHRRVRSIVEEIAQRIEDNNYRDTEAVVRSMPLARAQHDRAVDLVHADKRMRISYQALRITVEYFGELNRDLLARIDRETAPDRLANLVLGNAITVYEITQYVIDAIERFQLDGEGELQQVYAETKERLARLREEHRRLEQRAAASGVQADVGSRALESTRLRLVAIDECEREWDTYLADVGELHSLIGAVHGNLPTLEVIREDARLQIGVLQEIAMLRFLKVNADAVRGTVDTLQGFRLAKLTRSRLQKLFGA